MQTEFLSPAEAVARWVSPGAAVAVGGMQLTAAPMALVRELIRQRLPIGRLITSPSASMQADLLLGAGLVAEIMSPYVGFEHLGLAPCHRRAVEAGQVAVLECDEGSLTHALYAGAGGIPYIPCPPGIDLTDIPGVSPSFYRRATDPFTGQEGWAVPGLRPDLLLLHAQEADQRGNVAFGGYPFTDRLMALASRRVVVQVERLVERLGARPPGTTLPGFLIAAVVVVPGGCHPTAAPGEYGMDEAALVGYLKAAREPAGFSDWLERTVLAVSEPEYLAGAHEGGRAR